MTVNYSIIIPVLIKVKEDEFKLKKTLKSIIDHTKRKNYEIIIGYTSYSKKSFKDFKKYWITKLKIIKILYIKPQKNLNLNQFFQLLLKHHINFFNILIRDLLDLFL